MSQHGRGTFYIKRLIGLEHDTVQIKPPYVLVNGNVMDRRPAFERIYSDQNGYHGYTIPSIPSVAKYIHSESDTYTVPAKHLFVLGDNSPNSLDGRFWGSFPKKDLVGRAMLVYWPFTKRFGLID
jgi:signal peptidase I